MAHQLAIAKASFGAGLRKPDPTSVSQEDIAHFHTLLDAALTQCSPSNVQNCKAWLLKNTTPSPARITALGKYLVTLSASFVDTAAGEEGKARGTTASRRRLHVLYLLNDLLHDTKFHSGTPTAHVTFTTNLQRYINDLVKLAASYEQAKNRKCHARIVELLDVWEDSGYYSKEIIEALRQSIGDASTLADGVSTPTKDATGAEGESNGANTRDAPYIMPATHGDPLTPYYDLPAGNMIHLIRPNSPSPIDIRQMKALQMPTGPVDKALVNAVQDFLKDVDRIYEPAHHDDEGIVADIDEMGQTMVRDEMTGDLVPSEAYYEFKIAQAPEIQLLCQLQQESQQRSATERQSIAIRFEERLPQRRLPIIFVPAATFSLTITLKEISQPTAPQIEVEVKPPSATNMIAQPPPPPPPPQAALQGFFPNPQPFSTQPGIPFPMGPNGMPVPPPPPPNYNGPWPPPPPPLNQNMGYGTQAPPFPQFHSFVPPPPPPQMMHGMPFNGQMPSAPSPPNGPVGAWNYPPPQQMPQGGFGGGGGYGGSPPGRQRGGWNGQRGRGRGM
ncbi:hypothetical protein H2201_007298 [Coniosporium apollinis]|uniref:CID domain-containing protein n=2 Tax=Coniosporium TaxID=2810619 RepID=A0ABQ9NJA4_9PEZI|nr:hypothetical protein H2199_006156 [Cladosporium sp. JES 115]KAJ9659549.1 hypothetical protein H2201_007298 [Coniosporium apollinis]